MRTAPVVLGLACVGLLAGCTAEDNDNCKIVLGSADDAPSVVCDDGSEWRLADGDYDSDSNASLADDPQGPGAEPPVEPMPEPESQSCTVSEQDNGTYTVSCPDGTSVTLRDGQPGSDGIDGIDGANGIDGTDGNDGSDGQPGNDGSAGTSCTIEAQDGVSVLVCSDGTRTELPSTGDQPVADGSCTVSADEGVATVACDDGTSISFEAEDVVVDGDVLLRGPLWWTDDSRPVFDWSDSTLPGARYRLEVSLDLEFDELEFVELTTGSSAVVDQTLTHQQEYFWRVRVLRPDGTTHVVSAVGEFVMDIGSVYAPYTEPGDDYSPSETSPTLRWYRNDVAASYRLEIRADRGLDDEVTVYDDIEGEEFTLPVPLPDGDGDAYYWRVFPVDVNGVVGTPSEVRTYWVDNIPPAILFTLNGGEPSTALAEVTPNFEVSDGEYVQDSGLIKGDACPQETPEFEWPGATVEFPEFEDSETATMTLTAWATDGSNPPSCVTRSVQLSRRFVSGQMLREDTVWDQTDRPYVLRGDVLVARGATLTVGPGVSVFEGGLKVEGNLVIAGTEQARVQWVTPLKMEPEEGVAGTLQVSHADVSGWRWKVEGFAGGFITDSRFREVSNFGIEGPRANFLFEHNVVEASYMYATTYEQDVLFEFNENAFGQYDYVMLSVEAYAEDTLVLRGNSFKRTPDRPEAVETWGEYAIDARGNYWETTELDEIEEMVWHGDDDFSLPTIDFSDPLSEPAPNAPPIP